MANLAEYTVEEVAEHNSLSAGVWLVINGYVYDVTQFVDEHPGGEEVLMDNAGNDASSAFSDVGHSTDAVQLREGFLIGRIASSEPASTEEAAATETPSTQPVTKLKATGVSTAVALAIVGAAIAAYLIYRRYKK